MPIIAPPAPATTPKKIMNAQIQSASCAPRSPDTAPAPSTRPTAHAINRPGIDCRYFDMTPSVLSAVEQPACQAENAVLRAQQPLAAVHALRAGANALRPAGVYPLASAPARGRR